MVGVHHFLDLLVATLSLKLPDPSIQLFLSIDLAISDQLVFTVELLAYHITLFKFTVDL